jgi:hypothetical protein
MAVGSYDLGPGCTYGGSPCTTRPLAERWNGVRWSLQRFSVPLDSELRSVSCVSRDACTAVGTSSSKDGGPVGRRMLVETWNGSTWSIQPAPTPRGVRAIVDTDTGQDGQGVACASRRACTAFGDFVSHTSPGSPGPFYSSFVERWNGSRWAIQQLATPPGARGLSLSAVSCPSRSACTAVGSFTTSLTGDAGGQIPLAERWNR